MLRLFTLLMLLPALSAAQTADHPMFHHSGLPVPRFVSLKSGEVNLRAGPGAHFPIRWVYRRAGYPVEVIEEFGHWRKIRDRDATEGWVHFRLLSGARSAVIRSDDPQTRPLVPLYAAASATSRLVAELEPEVIVSLDSCREAWCRASVRGYGGWVQRTHLWGVYEGEAFEP